MTMVIMFVLPYQIVNLFIFALNKPFSDFQLYHLLIKFFVFTLKFLDFFLLLSKNFEICVQLIKPFKYLAELLFELIAHSDQCIDYSIGFTLLGGPKLSKKVLLHGVYEVSELLLV